MELPSHIFRSYDIRGLLEEVTPEIARLAGAALVRKTGAKTVLVGRDMRRTSPELQQAAIEGIVSMGADVLDIGLCSTSMYNFAVSSLPHVDAGLMVTASHNPPEYNGIKMAVGTGLPVSGTDIKAAIDELLERPVDTATRGTVTQHDVLSEYLTACIEALPTPDLRGAKVVVDYGNGMGAVSLRPLCERLGIHLVELFAEPDARFPNHEPNPAIEKNLTDVIKAVRRENADLGVALDGDADRIAFIDNEGVPVRGDLSLAVFAQDLLAREPGAKVVVAPNQSWTTVDAIREAGGIPVEERIGRTLVIAAMHRDGAALGGEVSSHFFFREFHGLEAVDHAFVRMLGIWKRSGKPFAELVRPLRRYANSWEINVSVPDKHHALAAIETAFASTATTVNRLDGIRCEFGRDWWFIVRPSNTEPLIRIIVEAIDESSLKRHTDELLHVLHDVGAHAVVAH